MTQLLSRFLATGECGGARRTLGWHGDRNSQVRPRHGLSGAGRASAGAEPCTAPGRICGAASGAVASTSGTAGPDD
ncbi:protein of unknown function [Modestobacter italicus]|uniref:Uncharacterized protein n=1 Tax=Modestobacter italicus (strain DSM 44449 / CECT 9708 / BC 501) TaxID=2732864 RepID=I4F5A7_MODI5|nr:protein of unknown function [Modestobacter marinus]